MAQTLHVIMSEGGEGGWVLRLQGLHFAHRHLALEICALHNPEASTRKGTGLPITCLDSVCIICVHSDLFCAF